MGKRSVRCEERGNDIGMKITMIGLILIILVGSYGLISGKFHKEKIVRIQELKLTDSSYALLITKTGEEYKIHPNTIAPARFDKGEKIEITIDNGKIIGMVEVN